MQRLTDQIINKRLEIKQDQFQKFEEDKRKASMVQAYELASSILDISKADIDELLDVDIYEVILLVVLEFVLVVIIS